MRYRSAFVMVRHSTVPNFYCGCQRGTTKYFVHAVGSKVSFYHRFIQAKCSRVLFESHWHRDVVSFEVINHNAQLAPLSSRSVHRFPSRCLKILRLLRLTVAMGQPRRVISSQSASECSLSALHIMVPLNSCRCRLHRPRWREGYWKFASKQSAYNFTTLNGSP